MVPEQRVKTCKYTVCHMVPETTRQDLHLHGLQDGAGKPREDLHLSGLPHGAGAEDLQLHGLPHGARATRQDVQYTVCHMVPEKHVKTCTYTVCKMVPETRVKTCTYRSATWCRSRRPAATRCATWCRSNT